MGDSAASLPDKAKYAEHLLSVLWLAGQMEEAMLDGVREWEADDAAP